jgi:vacuolar-type H+-ATPase subunit I/STV1
VNLLAIRERVRSLQGEIAELRTANENYLNRYHHTPLEVHAQRQRELRLQQILDELALLTRTKIV